MAGATLRQAGGQPRRERARGATGSGACADRADDADADGDAVDRAGDVVVGGVLEVDLEAVAVAHAAQSDPADPGVARQGRTQTRLGVTCLLQVGHGSSGRWTGPAPQPSSVAPRDSRTVPRAIVKTCGSACHAARASPPDSSGRSTSLPFLKVAPARTRATRWGALTARQRCWADSMSLNAMATPAAREPGPLVMR